MVISSDDYLEFVAQWTQGDRRDFARRWMEDRGFTVTPTISGVALLGTRTQIEKAFRRTLVRDHLKNRLSMGPHIPDPAGPGLLRNRWVTAASY
jgi:hypothetical protein